METNCKGGQSENDGHSISDLPDDVVSYILSLMATRDAVRTSVLSRDWKYKWTSIYKVDVNDGISYKGEDRHLFSCKRGTMEGFVNFVERIFLLSQYMTCFRLQLLSTCQYESSRITSWISAALMRNVEILKVIYYARGGDGIVLTQGLPNNMSLRQLVLNIHCTIKVPSMNSFPNLRFLTLGFVDIVNDSSSSDTLVLVFPVLETLRLTDCHLLNVKMVEFHAPSLTTVVACYMFRACTAACPIKIVSTSLVKFMHWEGLPKDYIFVGQQVVDACLAYPYTHRLEQEVGIGMHARKLLNEFSILQELKIINLTEAIAQTTFGVGASLPIRLHHLTRLAVGHTLNVKGLLELLNAAPLLKFLEIDQPSLSNHDFDAIECVPPCIKDVLEEVKFSSFTVFELAKFLLKNGRKLKIIHVYGHTPDIAREKASKLSKFPRCSRLITFKLHYPPSKGKSKNRMLVEV